MTFWLIVAAWYLIGCWIFLWACKRISDINVKDIVMMFVGGIVGPFNLIYLWMFWKG